MVLVTVDRDSACACVLGEGAGLGGGGGGRRRWSPCVDRGGDGRCPGFLWPAAMRRCFEMKNLQQNHVPHCGSYMLKTGAFWGAKAFGAQQIIMSYYASFLYH